MAIDWKKLQASDFVIKKPEWPPSRPSAEVEVNGTSVELAVDRRLTVTDAMVNIFVAALQNWDTAASQIAPRTQRYLQKFLPGRIIVPSELSLWAVTLYLDDSVDHNPISVLYLFNVGGDYANESYKTIEFNEESTVEIKVKIRNGEIDMSKLSFDVINDF